MGGLQNYSGRCEEAKDICLAGNQTLIPGHLHSSLINIVTELSWEAASTHTQMFPLEISQIIEH
jgi:hypothetical protein